MSNKQNNNGKRNLIVVVLILAAIGGFAYYRVNQNLIQNSKRNSATVYNVESIILKKQWLIQTLSFEGLIEGDPQVKIYPQVSGIFDYNTVLEGAYVTNDQPISFIDRNLVGQDFKLAPVSSTINGIVTKLYYMDKGAPVGTDNPVAVVADTNKIKVVLNVGENDLLKIKEGMPAKIYYANDKSISLEGSVYTVTPFVDSDTLSGNVTVRTINNSSIIKIGMSVIVEITIGKIFAFVVPEESIVSALDEINIFVNDHGKARQVTITKGYAYNGLVEIKGDLQEGDAVITKGAFKINDGDMINTTR